MSAILESVRSALSALNLVSAPEPKPLSESQTTETQDAVQEELSPLFLGLDLSTQQLKAIVIDASGSLVHSTAVNFDRDLPHYGTSGGAIKGPKGESTSPVSMWVEAMDLLLTRMKEENVEFGRIRGIAGAGQQHGSVYWTSEATELLANLKSSQPLLSQLHPTAFSIANSPIWQDSSTTAQCKMMDEAIGGAQAMADLTGSRSYERFTGPQIAKIRTLRPEAYAQTAHISLVSSFVASLFLGSIAPIEISDASGMNLMDVFTHKWSDKLLEICAGSEEGGKELKEKFNGEPVPGGTVLGTVRKWWTERWGFSPECIVAPFTGDNPASMVSLSTPGDAIVSLGTSTTLLLAIPPSETDPPVPPKRFTTSHLLAHPTTLDAQIAMLCYKNGALAREKVRDAYCASSSADDPPVSRAAAWNTFNEHVTSTPAGNNGFMGFYFPLPEIIPPNVLGNFFFYNGQRIQESEIKEKLSIEDPSVVHARAILESQLLSMKARIEAILPPAPQTHTPHDHPGPASLHRLVLTGGASSNPIIQKLCASVFGLPAFIADTNESAGHGGALLALFAWWKAQQSEGKGTFEELKATLRDDFKLVAEPDAEVTETYDGLVATYNDCEEQVVKIWESEHEHADH